LKTIVRAGKQDSKDSPNTQKTRERRKKRVVPIDKETGYPVRRKGKQETVLVGGGATGGSKEGKEKRVLQYVHKVNKKQRGKEMQGDNERKKTTRVEMRGIIKNRGRLEGDTHVWHQRGQQGRGEKIKKSTILFLREGTDPARGASWKAKKNPQKDRRGKKGKRRKSVVPGFGD